MQDSNTMIGSSGVPRHGTGKWPPSTMELDRVCFPREMRSHVHPFSRHHVLICDYDVLQLNLFPLVQTMASRRIDKPCRPLLVFKTPLSLRLRSWPIILFWKAFVVSFTQAINTHYTECTTSPQWAIIRVVSGYTWSWLWKRAKEYLQVSVF
jgi:hypothetical protein